MQRLILGLFSTLKPSHCSGGKKGEFRWGQEEAEQGGGPGGAETPKGVGPGGSGDLSSPKGVGPEGWETPRGWARRGGDPRGVGPERQETSPKGVGLEVRGQSRVPGLRGAEHLCGAEGPQEPLPPLTRPPPPA